MKALAKWLLIVVAVLVLLVTVGFPLLVDESKLRQQLVTEAGKQGIVLEVPHPLQLSMLPVLELEAEVVRVQANPEKKIPAVEIADLQLQAALLPLLQKQLFIERFEAVVDGARWQGQAMVQPKGESAVVRFELQGEHLEVDRYLPPADQGKGVDPVVGAAAGVTQLPLEPLRVLDLQGRVSLERLKMAGVEVSDIALSLSAQQGVLKMEPITAVLYGGRYQGSMQADLRGEVPQTAFTESLQQVDLGRLVEALSGVASIRGVLMVEGQARASGVTVPALLESLDGGAALEVKEGALVGINLNRVVRQAQALIERKPLPVDNEPNETRFDDLHASLVVEQGRLRSDDLTIDTHLMALNGSGWVDLASQQIDYRLTARVKEGVNGGDYAGLERLAGQRFPVSVRGTLSKPQVDVDLDEVLKQALQQRLKKKLGNKLQQLMGTPERGETGGANVEEQLKKNFGNLLQKLF